MLITDQTVKITGFSSVKNKWTNSNQWALLPSLQLKSLLVINLSFDYSSAHTTEVLLWNSSILFTCIQEKRGNYNMHQRALFSAWKQGNINNVWLAEGKDHFDIQFVWEKLLAFN